MRPMSTLRQTWHGRIMRRNRTTLYISIVIQPKSYGKIAIFHSGGTIKSSNDKFQRIACTLYHHHQGALSESIRRSLIWRYPHIHTRSVRSNSKYRFRWKYRSKAICYRFKLLFFFLVFSFRVSSSVRRISSTVLRYFLSVPLHFFLSFCSVLSSSPCELTFQFIGDFLLFRFFFLFLSCFFFAAWCVTEELNYWRSKQSGFMLSNT